MLHVYLVFYEESVKVLNLRLVWIITNITDREGLEYSPKLHRLRL